MIGSALSRARCASEARVVATLTVHHPPIAFSAGPIARLETHPPDQLRADFATRM